MYGKKEVEDRVVVTCTCCCLNFVDMSPPDRCPVRKTLDFCSLSGLLVSLSMPASLRNVTSSQSGVSPIKAHSAHCRGMCHGPTRVQQIPLYVAERSHVRRILVHSVNPAFMQDSVFHFIHTQFLPKCQICSSSIRGSSVTVVHPEQFLTKVLTICRDFCVFLSRFKHLIIYQDMVSVFMSVKLFETYCQFVFISDREVQT